MKHFVIAFSLLLSCVSCTEYTPKPRGYFRIEPELANYKMLSADDLPYAFNVSGLAKIQLPPAGEPTGWINIGYPSLGATIYCSYLPITPSTLSQAQDECRALVVRQIRRQSDIEEKAYANPTEQVYGSLFLSDGESASPIQFMLTDSVSHFFRGALYYDCISNADSLAPVTQYLCEDILELIQSFSWKK